MRTRRPRSCAFPRGSGRTPSFPEQSHQTPGLRFVEKQWTMRNEHQQKVCGRPLDERDRKPGFTPS